MSELCGRMHALVHRLPVFRFPFEGARLPTEGVYVMFEAGELAHGTERIIHVGSHRAPGHLQARLKEHFETENKDRSILRKHIGRALLTRDEDPFLGQWEIDLTPRQAREMHRGSIDPEKLQQIERQVTEYIRRSFSFVVLEVRSRAYRKRLVGEIIATLAQCPECGPSPGWLGLHSPKAEIRESGLWNVQHLCGEQLSEEELDELARIVDASLVPGGL